jgi:hypothetical protein
LPPTPTTPTAPPPAGSTGASAPAEGLSLVRLDAARDRLRAAIPPRADED